MSGRPFPWSQETVRRIVVDALGGTSVRAPGSRDGQSDADTDNREASDQGPLAARWVMRTGAEKDSHRPWCVAIGAFDGVHKGHRKLVQSCAGDAAARSARSVVVLFDPDPSELFSSDPNSRLLGIDARMGLLFAQGVDAVCAIRFDEALASKTPQEFLEALREVLGGSGIASVHVGVNFRFGAHAAGDVSTLGLLGQEMGFDVVTHDLVRYHGQPVSSTRIREELAGGHVLSAAELLERAHYVRGTVRHGRGEGTSFGFPTANVELDQRDCLPRDGVYACLVTDGSTIWPAAANVGAPPTFSAPRSAFLEANLLGFSGDLYEQEVAVVFVAWLRASRRFDSLEELEQTVLGNIAWVRENLGATALELSA